ncbi:unnamed protein product [Rhizophagus irregularis]|nr:unnamed protein product [Rhizophagus irregularis]
MQHNQMNENLLYHANKITISEGQDEDSEDNDEDYENSEDGEDGEDGDDDDDEQSDDEELISNRCYNEKFPDFQEELAITIYSEKNTVKPMYKHQIRTDFSLLYEIRHTQAFLETAKQNLSHKAKYNQGFGYMKKAIGLAFEIGCEDELNEILQR